MVKLYKSGDGMGIETDAKEPEQFIFEISGVLSELIERGVYDSDWTFQLQMWLPQIIKLYLDFSGLGNSSKISIRKIRSIGDTNSKNIVPMEEEND